MNTAIAGVATSDKETTVMTAWPSIARYPLGRLLGRLYSINVGPYVFKIGNFIALATAPFGALLVLARVAPFIGTRFRITSQRIIEEKGLLNREHRSVNLDRFDDIEVIVRPGQAWFEAGDLIFRKGDTETFRLHGVGRPESFRQACLKSQRAFVGVKEAVGNLAVA